MLYFWYGTRISVWERKKHPYHSQVCQRQADDTRQHILVAARSLFESHGTELADVARQIEVKRRYNQARLIASLHEKGALRPDLSLVEATDVLWALTSHDLYSMLVVEQHWEPEWYETWLAQLLVQHLLASASG